MAENIKELIKALMDKKVVAVRIIVILIVVVGGGILFGGILLQLAKPPEAIPEAIIENGDIEMKFSVNSNAQPLTRATCNIPPSRTGAGDVKAEWLNDKALKIESCVSLHYLDYIKKGDFEIQGDDLILKFSYDSEKTFGPVCISCTHYYKIIYDFNNLEKKQYNLKIKANEKILYEKNLETIIIQSLAQAPEDCKKISNLEDKINCLLEIAGKNQNDEICLLPEIKDSNNTEKCIKGLIDTTGQYKECEKFKTERTLQDCYYFWAQLASKTEENSKVCNLLKNTEKKDHCYLLYARYSDCENIIDIDRKDSCYDEKARTECIENINMNKKCSFDFCEKIVDVYKSYECSKILNRWMDENDQNFANSSISAQ
ncbi:MAG: hypothetical protein AB1391_02240 [Candidatus Micrarchaeota archaeon]